MGMFSWITSDTNRSISIAGSPRAPFTVYLLAPDGKKYREDEYEGYGVFGGVDAHELMARFNAEALGLKEWFEKATADERRVFGIFLEAGSIYEDQSGMRWVVCAFGLPDLEFLRIFKAKGNYAEPAAEGLPSPNELIASGKWQTVTMTDAGLMKYPIKIVESPDLSYEDVTESERCPFQGFFY